MIKTVKVLFLLSLLLLLQGCIDKLGDDFLVVVSFDSQGGSSIEPITINVLNYEQPFPEPTREGYTFLGWYLDLDDEMFDYDFTQIKKHEVTVYAKWEKQSYTLTFNDFDGTLLFQTQVLYDNFLEDNYLESPERLGYTFNGWDMDLPNKMPKHDVVLIATYLVNRYTVSFETHGGNEILSLYMDYNLTFTVIQPIKEGHRFLGWYLDEDLETPFTSFVVPAYNITLHAKWEKQSYTLTFNDFDGTLLFLTSILYDEFLDDSYLESPERLGYTFNGWHIDLPNKMPAQHVIVIATYLVNRYTVSFETHGGNQMASLIQDYYSTLTITEPIKEGHLFLGWYLDENFETPFTNFIVPAYDITLHAKWEKQTYSITFDTQGGDYIGEVSILYMDSIELPTPTKLGFIFEGWFFDIYFENEFNWVTMPAENTIVYAMWIEVEYQIVYNLLGGTNHENNPLTANGSVEIPLYDPTMTGFTFVGWYLNHHFSGDPVTSIEQGIYTDIELHAKWQLNQYHINYVMLENPVNGNFGILNPGEGIVDVVDGVNHTFLLTSDHRVFVYGSANVYGQMGTKSSVYNYPIDITPNFKLNLGEYIVSIYASAIHSAAITSENRLFMWGSNEYGQCALSIYNVPDLSLPYDVTDQFTLFPTEEFMLVALGTRHSIVTTTHGRVFTFGSNTYGQLGLGQSDTLIHSSPVEITLAFNLDSVKSEYVKHVYANGYSSLAFTSENRVFVFGFNPWGALGTGTDVYQYNGLHEITHLFGFSPDEHVITAKITASNSGVLITSANRIFTWGMNFSGQLGIGVQNSIIQPVTEVTHSISLDIDETLVDASPGEVTMILTSKGKFFITGYNVLLVTTTNVRPTNNSTTFAERSSYFNLDENEFIVKLSHSSSQKRSVLTSEGKILSWGQTYNLGMGNHPSGTINKPSPINLVKGVATDIYFYTEVIDDLEYLIEGYQFMGWFIDSSLETPFDLNNMPAQDIIVYGHYIKLGT